MWRGRCRQGRDGYDFSNSPTLDDLCSILILPDVRVGAKTLLREVLNYFRFDLRGPWVYWHKTNGSAALTEQPAVHFLQSKAKMAIYDAHPKVIVLYSTH